MTQAPQPNDYEWHRAFAYLPRRVEGRWLWLRWYEWRLDRYLPGYSDFRRVP